MSSSSNIDIIQFATRQINIYGSVFVLVIGLFGEFLNIIVFTTLKTFRQTTCSFYLIITSTANICVLIVVLLRIIYDGFGLYYTPLLCKFRSFLLQYGGLVAMTSMCLATIDQFLSMTSYRRWNTVQNGHRLITFACIFWFVCDIFTFIYYGSYLNVCIIINGIFAQYFTYVQFPILFGFLPLIIMSTFSFLSFFKIRTIASRQINIVRLSRDRQLTAMTLFHVLLIVITITPFVIFFVYTLTRNLKDPIDIAHNRLIYAIIVFVYYIGYSCSFYIYCCVSKRFRKQVIYVLVDILISRWRCKKNNNQVMPHEMEMSNKYNLTAITSPQDIVLY